MWIALPSWWAQGLRPWPLVQKKQFQKWDKITGPGNIFVATAKKQVYGIVGIDMIAGHQKLVSLLIVVPIQPMWQLTLSQAEHDTRARAILVTDSEALADAVESEIERQLKLLPREAIARPSVENNGRDYYCQ